MTVSGRFSIQLDESTDVRGNISQLMVFVRYIHDGKILDDFLFCRGLASRTTAHDVLKVVSDFFTTEGLSWENVVGICTDGSPVMLGSRSGFWKLAQKHNPNVVGIHCMIHRQVLFSKIHPGSLRVHLQTVINIAFCERFCFN